MFEIVFNSNSFSLSLSDLTLYSESRLFNLFSNLFHLSVFCFLYESYFDFSEFNLEFISLILIEFETSCFSFILFFQLR